MLCDKKLVERCELVTSRVVKGQTRYYYYFQYENPRGRIPALVVTHDRPLSWYQGKHVDVAFGWDICRKGYCRPEDEGKRRSKATIFKEDKESAPAPVSTALEFGPQRRKRKANASH